MQGRGTYRHLLPEPGAGRGTTGSAQSASPRSAPCPGPPHPAESSRPATSPETIALRASSIAICPGRGRSPEAGSVVASAATVVDPAARRDRVEDDADDERREGGEGDAETDHLRAFRIGV